MDKFKYISMDGDNVGQMVGRAVLANDVEKLKEMSDKINMGQDIIGQWAEKNGGEKISSGGDEFTLQVPESALDSIDEVRKDYEHAIGFTLTAGVGDTLSESGKALMAGKFRGKNQTVFYDESVEEDLKNAKENVEQGKASEEEEKITEAYLSDKTGKDIQEQDKSEKEDLDNECQLCTDYGIDTEGCPYCEQVLQEGEKNEEDEKDPKEIEEALQEDVTPKEIAQSIDDTEMPLSNEMEGNISRPESFDNATQPGDMGQNHQAPMPDKEEVDQDLLSDTLKDNFEDKKDQIQKEKLQQSLSMALDQFKEQKSVLEELKNSSPKLYDANIAMLKAMIEMAKILQLHPIVENKQQPAEQQPTEGQASPQ